jgi:protein phosphatase 1 regulatory subunit 37
METASCFPEEGQPIRSLTQHLDSFAANRTRCHVIQAKSLRFLDISDNTLDRKSIDFLVSALTSPLPDSASTSLIMTSPMVSVDEVSSTRTPIMPQAPLLREAQASSHSSMGETASLSGLATLRMDGCGLRGAALEALCTSPISCFLLS